MPQTNVRPSPLAGSWYPAQSPQLRENIQGYLADADLPPMDGEIIGLLAPHAGLRHSGAVAGHAFKSVQGASYDTVVILSPYHQGHVHPFISSGHRAYHTPLGEVPVDHDCMDELDALLLEHLDYGVTRVRLDREHAVEIELPFLQIALSAPFKLLPLMLAPMGEKMAITLGRCLGQILRGKNALLVASSDLSHFLPEEEANQLDLTMLDAIGSFDPQQVLTIHNSGAGQACGVMGVVAVMMAAKNLGADRAQIFSYATSGKSSGDYSQVVGYGAGAFIK